jgi:hypothetical protein
VSTKPSTTQSKMPESIPEVIKEVYRPDESRKAPSQMFSNNLMDSNPEVTQTAKINRKDSLPETTIPS